MKLYKNNRKPDKRYLIMQYGEQKRDLQSFITFLLHVIVMSL